MVENSLFYWIFRTKEHSNASLELLQDANALPSPPIILPILPQDETNYRNEQTFQERAVPNVREMAWTSLVDTATKATSHNLDTANGKNNLYVERGSTHNVSPSSTSNIPQENTDILQLSPKTLETDVTYFNSSKDAKIDISDDENDRTIMDEVCKNQRLDIKNKC